MSATGIQSEGGWLTSPGKLITTIEVQSLPAIKKPKRIALVGVPILQLDAPRYCRVLQKYADEHKRWEFICNLEATPKAFKVIRMLDCDGVIVRMISPEMKRAARDFPIPIVNYSSWLDDPCVPTVRMNDFMAGQLCADYVMSKCFLRVGTVQLAEGAFHARRLAGFKERLRDVEIASLQIQSRPPGCQDMTRFREWIRRIKPPMALFLTDHDPAQLFMDVCLAEGLRIPQDVAFLVPRNREDEETYPFKPALTHVVFDADNCMSVAARKLDELMSGQIKDMGVVEIPPKELVERESSNTIPVDDPVIAGVIDQFRARRAAPINLKQVIDDLGMNRRTFDRHFRATIGMSAHDFISQDRCKLAASLLKSKPTLSLRQVASRCRFADARQMKKNLCRVFGLKSFSRRALPAY